MNKYLEYCKQLKEEVQFFSKDVDDILELENDCEEMDVYWLIHNLDLDIRELRKLMRKIKKIIELEWE